MATVWGEAFTSSAYVAHTCAGVDCLLGWYDDSYPGVDVRFNNFSAQVQGVASSRYGTATGWDHLWSARIPLVVGENHIEFTAADPAGNRVGTEIFVEQLPPAPSGLTADTGEQKIILSWAAVPGATGYRLYWSDHPFPAPGGVASVTLEGPSWEHENLLNGSTFYYAVTSILAGRESTLSQAISATAGAPSRPEGLSVTFVDGNNLLEWGAADRAVTYTLYWAHEPDAIMSAGTSIAEVESPYMHAGVNGMPYYYAVIAANDYGAGFPSAEAVIFPPVPPPPPVNLAASQSRGSIYLSWASVPGAIAYDVFRCPAWVWSTTEGCEPSHCYEWWTKLDSATVQPGYVDWNVTPGNYMYVVSATNPYGASPQSDAVGLCWNHQ